MPNDIANNMVDTIHFLEEDNASMMKSLTDLQLAYNEQMIELREAKRLLRLAISDFAKLDRENAQHKTCMMPEMDCAECPLSWDSIDDRVEPCHRWHYTDEAKKLLGERI